MSRGSLHGRAPGYPDADNDASIGQQEAALIWELRRLQRFVEEERDQQRFTHAIDLQREERPLERPRGQRRPSAKQPDSKVERLLDRLGFNRPKPAPRARAHGGSPTRQSTQHDAKVLVHPASEHARHERAHQPPELTRITAQDRIAASPPVDRRDAVRSALVAGQGLVRSHVPWERLRAG
jgi:hypothetical protein